MDVRRESENRSGTALGALSAAVYSGTMAGTFLGGIFAEYFGYRYSFLGSGFLAFDTGARLELMTTRTLQPVQ